MRDMHIPDRADTIPSRMSTRSERLIEIAIAGAGALLIAAATAANQSWLDRHFLSDFFIPRATQVRVETNIRIVAAGIGILLIFAIRRPLARFLGRDRVRTLYLVIAIVAAFLAAEVILRKSELRAKEEVSARKEPQRHRNAKLGWLFVPSRAGYQKINGRRIEYAFDRNGYRVSHLGDTTDFTRPTILFSGESIVVGEKLQWDETFPAQTARLMNVQSANVAVSGFANDQAFLRVQSELPRFQHPLAVVSLFSPSLFDRNLDDDRPHLGPNLAWQPAKQRWRLHAIVKRLLRYRSEEAIEQGIGVTRQVLIAEQNFVKQHGAIPLIVVPEFGEEQPRESVWRRRILDESNLNYVRVQLDPQWRVLDDGHPDVRGAHAIAAAIADRLRAQLGTISASRGLHETPQHDSADRRRIGRAPLQPRADSSPSRATGIDERGRIGRARRGDRSQYRRVRRMSRSRSEES